MMVLDTLSKMNEVLENKYPLNGKGLYGQEVDPVFLAIEDLAPLGFKMANRIQGLDMEHCLIAIRGLARFHASSVRVIEKVIPFHLTLQFVEIYTPNDLKQKCI